MAHTGDIYAAVFILATFSILGILGNGLAIYVFARNTHALPSTIFILTLAGIDFTTCLVTIPFTITMEMMDFKVSQDEVCKLYHFLISTTIPFSAFMMVAIAVDRYFCICHPFWKLMNVYKARITVVALGLLCVLLGVLSCLNFGIYTHPEGMLQNIMAKNGSAASVSNVHNKHAGSNKEQIIWNVNYLITNLDTNESFIIKNLVNTGVCQETTIVFGEFFSSLYMKIYASFYAICCIIVIVLYTIIYRFILLRRKKRLRTESFPCCHFKPPSPCEAERTEFIYLGQEATNHTEERDSKDLDSHSTNSSTKFKTRTSRDRSNLEMTNILKDKQERLRINNIKTACMLSIVALVFIFAFLPAWLMKHDVIEFNAVVFYMYFSYNVVNPIIYAFMNAEFREQLRSIYRGLKS